MPYSYEYPRPAVTADTAVFRGEGDDRRLLLIRRAAEPFKGQWALPGGFVEEGETLEGAARRELQEETGLEIDSDLMQVGAYGDPGRDLRGWVVTVVFAGTLGADECAEAIAGDDAAELRWYTEHALPPLAFDHIIIVSDAFQVVSSGA